MFRADCREGEEGTVAMTPRPQALLCLLQEMLPIDGQASSGSNNILGPTDFCLSLKTVLLYGTPRGRFACPFGPRVTGFASASEDQALSAKPQFPFLKHSTMRPLKELRRAVPHQSPPQIGGLVVGIVHPRGARPMEGFPVRLP